MTNPLAHIAELFGPLKATVQPVLPGIYLVLGVASLGWGASVWRWVRLTSGLFLGVAAGIQIGVLVHDTRVGLLAACVLALAMAALFYMAERVAVALLGGAVAVLAIDVIWPLVHEGQAATPLVKGLAGLGGTLLSGVLHQPAIKAVTAMFGAFLIAQAVGMGDKPVGILGVGVLGWAWQMFGHAPRGGGPPARSGKKQ